MNNLKIWWYPPPSPAPNAASVSVPSVGPFLYQRLFLWMPRKMWRFDFRCPNRLDHGPNEHLTSKGLYRNIREVIDIADRYYLAAEYLECHVCKKTFISHDRRLHEQLPLDLRDHFPIVLTKKFACDEKVVALMRSRTIGNSPTALCNDINEIHSDSWARKMIAYLANCKRHKKTAKTLLCRKDEPNYQELPLFRPIPGKKWFLATYIRDVWARLDLLKASKTSVLGNIIKIDSTKKLTRKLQGTAQKSACWCTNIGNETGAVLLSIFTTTESNSNLERAANGIMDRYSRAHHPPPAVLYTDRDCCNQEQRSKYQRLFHKWDRLKIRIDSWHYIRRLSKACVNESHPLYGTFMNRVSAVLFEWDCIDLNLLKQAKKEELENSGIPSPSDDLITKSISKKELAQHCKRRTRGTEETTQLLDRLFSALAKKTDALGVPLFRDDYMDIWETEKRHVKCLQDPEGVLLYTKTGELKKEDTLSIDAEEGPHPWNPSICIKILLFLVKLHSQ